MMVTSMRGHFTLFIAEQNINTISASAVGYEKRQFVKGGVRGGLIADIMHYIEKLTELVQAIFQSNDDNEL